MKKIVYLLVFVFVMMSLTSCGSKKKGCGLTANANTLPSQEIVVADVAQ
jgi:hypothetical protein